MGSDGRMDGGRERPSVQSGANATVRAEVEARDWTMNNIQMEADEVRFFSTHCRHHRHAREWHVEEFMLRRSYEPEKLAAI